MKRRALCQTNNRHSPGISLSTSRRAVASVLELLLQKVRLSGLRTAHPTRADWLLSPPPPTPRQCLPLRSRISNLELLTRSALGVSLFGQPDTTVAMGRYNFAPQRVHQAATRLLQVRSAARGGASQPPPPWYTVIGNLPPSERLVRPPLQPARRKGRKASKLFQPVNLKYEEDQLRLDFFGDHPWELARPRQIVEDDGKDYQKFDWSQLDQPTKQIDGERCTHLPTYLTSTVMLTLQQRCPKTSMAYGPCPS